MGWTQGLTWSAMTLLFTSCISWAHGTDAELLSCQYVLDLQGDYTYLLLIWYTDMYQSKGSTQILS